RPGRRPRPGGPDGSRPVTEPDVSPGERAVQPEPTARLFVGAWPPAEVSALLSTLARPSLGAVRWTAPEHWHVTFAFLGDVAVSRLGDVGAAVLAATARAAAPPEAHLGPATRCLGRHVLCVPVDGLDELALTVRRALDALLPGASLDGPFLGHLTLARSRGRRDLPASLAGAPVEARWQVREVDLVRSELGPAGARYTTLVRATVPT
ncbi:MAG: 2'-5' RNA ligase family protein, partial [Acidimicrobiales bacterium]